MSGAAAPAAAPRAATAQPATEPRTARPGTAPSASAAPPVTAAGRNPAVSAAPQADVVPQATASVAGPPRGSRADAAPATAAETLVAAMAREIEDGAVVATGVASPLAILAIAVARATHAPRLTYIACVGALDPAITALHPCSEDLAYLDGRSGEVSIPDLFDHARRGRIDVMFFGAAEVDASGATNLSAAGSLERPRTKFPGVAGAASLRRWVARPVIVVGRQSRRNLVPRVQVASTTDPGRRTRLLTDLGSFELGAGGAVLCARHATTPAGDMTDAGDTARAVAAIAERTGFPFRALDPLPVTPPPTTGELRAIRRIDAAGLRERLAG